MTDEELLRLARAVLAYLRGEGVPDEDVMGTARVGVLIAAIREGCGADAQALRSWLDALPPMAPEPIASSFVRYVARAGSHVAMFVVAWRQVAEAQPDAADDEVLRLLCQALDRIEAERMVATLEAG